MSAPIIPTMDHCLLQVPRALLRLRTPRKYAHFAGKAGAVMDGGGLNGCLDAGHCQVGFAVTTNPCRCSESCPRSPLSNLCLCTPRSDSDDSPSLFPSSSPRAAETPSLVRTIDRPVSAAGPHVERNATDFDCRSNFNWESTESSSARSIRGESFRTRVAQRHQVSVRDDDRRLTETISPPTNPHLGALGLALRGTGRGLLVCRREFWRHGSRARAKSAAPRVSDFWRRRAADAARWHDFQSAALPSVRRRPPDLPPAVFGSAPASAACLETVVGGVTGQRRPAARPNAFIAAKQRRGGPRQTRPTPSRCVRTAKKAEQNQNKTRA